MRHIPFAALPPAERQALAEALQRSRLPLHQVCISRLEPAGAGEGEGEGGGIAMVTAPGWSRSYDAAAGWITLLERDLLALRAGTAQAQSGLPKQGDKA